jgi:hypothetical protein
MREPGAAEPTRRTAMRFLMMVKADADYEDCKPPSAALMEAMGRLTVEMTQAGKLISAEGLLPTRFGAARVRAAGGKRSVIDGPFAEAKELIGGFAIMQAESMDEAKSLVERMIAVHEQAGVFDVDVEIRTLADPGTCGGAPQ